MKPQIVNIINFIRGVEPRDLNIDLVKPVLKQIEIMKKHGLRGTFLFQYDALIEDKFTRLFQDKETDIFEKGLWLEIVQPLVEKAGINWRGREGYSWDWHSNVGFSVGYTQKEREMLIDIAMEEFKNIFGDYPKSVGSWTIDIHSLKYMHCKYNIVSSCNCKDQWGTDGYTLWGGYYGQAYYPSINNMFTPAQSKDFQLDIPVFRMLGSDPIYQYDIGLDLQSVKNPAAVKGVASLEPVYKESGGSKKWVKWFFKENFSNNLSFGYVQAGQENSFGWGQMKKGFRFQSKLISKLCKKGELRVETLEETGRWYRSKYCVTPASTLLALSDHKARGNKSLWYYSRYYRMNIMQQNQSVWIRDIYKFEQAYKERYLDETCKTENLTYDNLPVVDGNLWSGKSVLSGIFPAEQINDAIKPIMFGDVTVETINDDKLIAKWNTEKGIEFKICGSDKKIEVSFEFSGWFLELRYNLASETIRVNKNELLCTHNGYEYKIEIKECSITHLNKENIVRFVPEKDTVSFVFAK